MFGAILGGLGLLSGLIENDKNRKSQNSAINAANAAQMAQIEQSQPLIDRQVALYDLIKDLVQNADKSGQFNPDWLISQLDSDYQRNLGTTTGNIAGNLKSLGYRPGDSEVTQRLDSVTAKMTNDRDRLATDLRRQTFADKLNAYGSIPAGLLSSAGQMSGNLANSQIGFNSQLANYYGSKIQNPSAFLNYIQPFLGGTQNQGLAQSSQPNYDLLNIPGGQVGGGLNW